MLNGNKLFAVSVVTSATGIQVVETMQNIDDEMQSVRELEWFASYFKQHSREDLADEILEQLCLWKSFVQQSLKVQDNCDVIDLQTSRANLDKIE